MSVISVRKHGDPVGLSAKFYLTKDGSLFISTSQEPGADVYTAVVHSHGKAYAMKGLYRSDLRPVKLLSIAVEVED